MCNSEYCCPVLGLIKVRSTFDQLANVHSDTLRDLAPFLCMERSNRIPMEIFRLATRNENQRTNGPVNAHRGSEPPPPAPRNLKSLVIPKKGIFFFFFFFLGGGGGVCDNILPFWLDPLS